jgi:DNA-binding NarL/FixJ family response regulator
LASANAVRVVIVDDHRLMVEGLASLIHEWDDLKVVGVATTMAGAIETVRTARPDVVLMDSCLRDGSGAQAAERIRSECPESAVLLLSADVSDREMAQAVQAGARGYLSKAVCAEELVNAIRRVAQGEFLVEPAAVEHVAPALTDRENQVLHLMATGLDNFDIAERLGLGYAIVHGHVRGVLEKLEVRSRLEAVATARRYGLIKPD